MPPNLLPLTKGIAMNRTKWLTCLASPGQFSDEVALRCRDYQNKEFSLFVYSEFVNLEAETSDNSEVRATVQVAILDEKDGLCLVKLPGQTFDNGSTVTVSANQLEGRQLHQPA